MQNSLVEHGQLPTAIESGLAAGFEMESLLISGWWPAKQAIPSLFCPE